MQAFDSEKIVAHTHDLINVLFADISQKADGMQAHEAEEFIFEKIRAIGLRGMEFYFAERGTGNYGKEITRFDGTVHKRQPGLRSKDYQSVFGAVKVPRTYYWTDGEKGVHPLDEEVNLPRRQYSYFLQQFIVDFCADDEFYKVESRIKKIFGQSVVQNCIENIIRDADEDYDDFYESGVCPPKKIEGTSDVLVVGFDGKGVPLIRSEAAKVKAKLGKGEKRQKKKEALVGVCYQIKRNHREPEDLAYSLVYPEEAKMKRESLPDDEKKPLVQGEEYRRFASLTRQKKEVMNEILSEAERRDPEHEHVLALVMDGAFSLWNIAPKIFKAWKLLTLILDIIHVRDYLWEAANALYGERSDLGKKWVYDKLRTILEGNVSDAIKGIRLTLSKRKLRQYQTDALERAAKYFENHKEWMKYDEYLAMGLPIASGAVESACGSVVKDRMEGCGKRWSMEGAEAVLLLRSLSKSGHLESYLEHFARKEGERNYKTRYTYAETLNIAPETPAA